MDSIKAGSRFTSPVLFRSNDSTNEPEPPPRNLVPETAHTNSGSTPRAVMALSFSSSGRANTGNARQSWPDSGHGFPVQVSETSWAIPSSPGSGARNRVPVLRMSED